MKITDKIPPIKIETYVHQTQQQNESHGSGSGNTRPMLKEDKVELSKTAKDVHKARVRLDAVPDIRQEKVNEIKNQIQNGTYAIDSRKIASKMMEQFLLDE